MTFPKALVLVGLMTVAVCNASPFVGHEYRQCTAANNRCSGDDNHPYVKYAPCCDLYGICAKAPELGWGRFCISETPVSGRRTCYTTGQRCMGAPGKLYVDYHPCCGGAECVKDASMGWGSFCKDARYRHAPINVLHTTKSPPPASLRRDGYRHNYNPEHPTPSTLMSGAWVGQTTVVPSTPHKYGYGRRAYTYSSATTITTTATTSGIKQTRLTGYYKIHPRRKTTKAGTTFLMTMTTSTVTTGTKPTTTTTTTPTRTMTTNSTKTTMISPTTTTTITSSKSATTSATTNTTTSKSTTATTTTTSCGIEVKLEWNKPEDLDLQLQTPTEYIFDPLLPSSISTKNQDDGVGGTFLSGASGIEIISIPCPVSAGQYVILVANNGAFFNEEISCNVGDNMFTLSITNDGTSIIPTFIQGLAPGRIDMRDNKYIFTIP